MTPNHPIPPERIRAEAERVVNEFAAKNTRMAAFDSMVWDDRCRERFLALVAAGASLVDVSTVQREAAAKALGHIYGQLVGRPAVDKDVALAVVSLAVQSKEGYLASTYPAPAPRECVLSWGVMAQDKQGQWCVWSSWPVDRGTSLLAVTDSPWHHVRCFADAEAIKQFAERAK